MEWFFDLKPWQCQQIVIITISESSIDSPSIDTDLSEVAFLFIHGIKLEITYCHENIGGK